MQIPPQPIKWLHGDPRWSYISNLASWAPVIVFSLFIICIIQISLGAVWISKLGGDLSFALILQPLVLPCISLFNTVPSLHLYLYTHNNNPKLVIWFSGIMCVLYLASAIIDLAACSGSGISGMESECWRDFRDNRALVKGPDIGVNFWNTCIGLWLISAVGYGFCVFVATKVLLVMRRRDLEAKARGETRAVDLELETMTQEQKEAREKKARERWERIRDL